MSGRIKFLVLMAVLILVAGACTSSDGSPFGGDAGSSGSSSDSGSGDGGGNDGGSSDGSSDDPSDDSDGGVFGGEAFPQPGALFQGLSQYDSYRMTLAFTLGSGAGAPPNATDIAVDYSAAEGGWHMALTTDDGTGAQTQETYWKAGAGCSNDGFEWAPLAFTLEERDLYGALWAGFDLMFKVRSPEFVGDETYAGVDAEHYSAEVAGLGTITGGVPSDSRVDYWLAADGGALIGYDANIETSTGPAGDPASEVFTLDIAMSASDLNQPVPITPPPECPVGTEPPGGGGGGGGDSVVLPGLVETLGTYDSYRFSFETVFGSPSLGNTEATIELAVAKDGSWSQTISQVAEGETTTSAQYFDGQTLCQYDGFEYSVEPLTQEQSGIFGAVSQQMDFVPVVVNPQPAGAEVVSGFETTRYTFDVAGIGAGTSTAAGGEYWLTADGQLLKYQVDLSAAAPDGTQIEGLLGLSLDELNGDVVVTIPPECAAAAEPPSTEPPPTDTTLAAGPPPLTGEPSGTIDATGAFEASSAVGEGQLTCEYDSGFLSFSAVGASGFSVGGLVFNLDPLAPGAYEMDDVFAFAPLGTPAGDAGTVFERFAGGPGVGDLVIEAVSADGSVISVSFVANLESSPPSSTSSVFGSFSCPVV